jgi:hypothetical protein
MDSQAQENAWRRMYRSNKGAVLILLAEAVATSMDAIVRFLQQGGGGMHPFQVRLTALMYSLDIDICCRLYLHV